jgi:hypothetical protein
MAVVLPKPSMEALIEDCKSLSIDKIAEKYSASRATVNRWLRLYDIKASVYLSTSDKLKQVWSTAEFRDKMSIIQNDPTWVVRASERTKQQWQDPGFKAKHSGVEYIAAVSVGMKKIWQDPEYRTKQADLRLRLSTDVEYLAKKSKTSKANWQDQEYRIKTIAAQTGPEFRAKMAIARENMPRSLTKPHVKVCELLTSLGVSYVTEKAIGPWSFDIFVESTNLLIEVQGDYWHNLPKAERTDASKSTYIINNLPQYRLKYIWEHECLTEGSVLAKLKYWLGLDRVEQINYELDKISVKPVLDTKQADTFLYNWHYQHHGRHGLDLGGYLGDELICLARFTNPSRNEIATSMGYTQKKVLELARLVVHPKYQKKNLLSWFLTRCERHIKQTRPAIECLVSFADSTHNHTGAVYKASNWELNRIVEPNYWYIDSGGWVMHKRTLWSHSKRMRISEAEYAEKNGFIKVWGKEKYKFTRKLK